MVQTRNQPSWIAGPWRVVSHEPGDPDNNGLAGYSIQTDTEGIAYNISSKANASRIVTAVNAHDELVSLLVVMTDYLDSLGWDVYDARALLARITGE